MSKAEGAASGVLGTLSCSGTVYTIHVPESLRPCLWKGASWRPLDWVGEIADLFEHPAGSGLRNLTPGVLLPSSKR